MKKKKQHSKKDKRRRRSKSTALAVTPHVVYVEGKQHRLDSQEVQLVRDLCAKGANNQEFELFLHICRKSRLDPLIKQIYCVIWPTKGGTDHDMVIITGINGLRMMAARDHADFGGASSAKFTWFDPPRKTPAGKPIPESATVEIHSKVGPSITSTVYWEEFAPRDLTDKRADFWNRMPCNQLEKCGEAKGVRKRFPGLGNIFTPEEVDARLQDLTPEGRQISTNGVAPSGAIVDKYAYGRAQQQQVLDEKLPHGHEPGSERAKVAEATLARVEEEDRRLLAARNVTPKPSAPIPETKPRHSAPQAAKPPARKIPAGAIVVKGNLTRCVSGVTTVKGVPYRKVLIGRDWYTCWITTIFGELELYGRGGGFLAEVYVDKAKGTLQGLIQIGPTKYEEDGRTPITLKREPGEEGFYAETD